MNLGVLTIKLISNFRSNCISNLAPTTWSDPINILYWSLASMNTFDICILVSGIIDDVEMTLQEGEQLPKQWEYLLQPWYLSLNLDLLSGEREMRILSCRVIAYLLSVISGTSLNGMWILET